MSWQGEGKGGEGRGERGEYVYHLHAMEGGGEAKREGREGSSVSGLCTRGCTHTADVSAKMS